MDLVNDNLAELLTISSAFFLSLLFAYIPPLRKWYYEKLNDQWRPGFMALVLLVIALGLMLVSCTEIWISVSCDQNGWIVMGVAWIVALGANQGTYSSLVRARNKRLNGGETLPKDS